jgi:F-type H+-transporting ATPase subunit b
MIKFNETILYQFANLLIVLIFLHFFLFKPILKALNKRRTTIQSLGDQAGVSAAAVADLGKSYEERLAQGKSPVVDERDGFLKEAHAASMKIIEEARRELTDELAKVKDTVKQETEKTLEALRGESHRLASEIVKKLVKRGT